ncbi:MULTISPECIES: DUF4333 domain-containing protein [Amycolatopsis]|uniref:DUF4333 domain-containing protein n=1 Tax=Amycolatopsis tucumanensis TaxID=401106 RepID=A0ABP7J568_9PSEU|nr:MULTISPECIES: DUF4333 domain-containing protein [Amycolatopsis]MCF6423240.1 DUF4333 domain-containing protein [Amycolatopsis tucumanensis]
MFRAALVVCSALLLAGCTVTVGATPSLSQETVEQGISDTVLRMVGHRPEAVDCPDPLAAQPGNTARCVLTDGGKRYGVTATVTAVANGGADYRIQVDDQPLENPWFG